MVIKFLFGVTRVGVMTLSFLAYALATGFSFWSVSGELIGSIGSVCCGAGSLFAAFIKSSLAFKIFKLASACVRKCLLNFSSRFSSLFSRSIEIFRSWRLSRSCRIDSTSDECVALWFDL